MNLPFIIKKGLIENDQDSICIIDCCDGGAGIQIDLKN